MSAQIISQIDLVTALARVADAPVIACLVGSAGATLVWQDEPNLLSEIPAASFAAARQENDAQLGSTWGTVPAGATLVQYDYEWPNCAPIILPAPAVVRWNAQGRCEIVGEPTAAAAMFARLSVSAPLLSSARLQTPLRSAWDEAGHQQRIARIHAWIAAGDCYQVNLAVPFHGRLAPQEHADIATFLTVLQASPAPYAGFFRVPGRASVISASPECFLAAQGEQLVSVPIKGTRARIPGAEKQVRAELLAAGKDAAELAMIVDLVRNDLGRVARAGSVRVADPALLLDLPYVHHRAARIVAQREQPFTACVQAAFPAGSITGAPKIRAMQIIAELEGAPRGPAYGCFGWQHGDAAGELAVAIRTATVAGYELCLHAGGGIVWDSDPAAEWQEVLAKTAGFSRALLGTT